MHDFCAVVAFTITEKWEREFFVLGMTLMPGPHNAENLALALETILSQFVFPINHVSGKKANSEIIE